MRTTIGQLLVAEALPEDLRRPDMDLSSKGAFDLMRQVYEKHPDKYREIAHKLYQVGHYAAQSSGSTVRLADLIPPPELEAKMLELRARIKALSARQDLSREDRNDLLRAEVLKANSSMEKELFDSGVASGNNLAVHAKSGSRGNSSPLKQIMLGDFAVTDSKDRVIPVPILHSYAEGVTPAEYFAASYGARKGALCLAPDTDVLMADYSVKKIVDISPGEWVMGADLGGRTFPVRVKEKYANGVRDIYRYRFRQGQCHKTFVHIDATEDHKVLATIKAGQTVTRSIYTPTPLPLKRATICASPVKNTYVAVPLQGERSTHPGGADEPLAMLVGMMLGNGGLTQGSRYTFSCDDDLLMSELKSHCLPFNLGFHSQPDHGCCHWLSYADGSGVGPGSGNGSLHPVKRRLREMGLEGKYAWEKEMPEGVMEWSTRSACELVAGLFSTDGSIAVHPTHVDIPLSLTSLKLVRQLKRLLELKLGIWCSDICTSIRSPEPGEPEQRPMYGFTVAHLASTKRFAKIIPLMGVKRQRLLDALARLDLAAGREFYPFKVYSREPLGATETYDLEVESDEHLFVLANGLIVSNSTKEGTAKSGFLGKQLAFLEHRLTVTEKDCGATSGLPVDATDPDNTGAVLARDSGDLKSGIILSSRDVKNHKPGKILVRSPLTCWSPHGVCAKCAGQREKGRLPDVGDNIGIAAAQAVGERVAQMSLGAKHGGGTVGGQSAVGQSGFALINSFLQAPRVFQGAATVASLAGQVSSIDAAPQGGHYIRIGGKEHYVGPDHTVTVKAGETVDPGDPLSNGVVTPRDTVQYKGIGEARRQFVTTFLSALRENGVKAHRRNIELLARGLINHVRVTDMDGVTDALPDDVMPYDVVARQYHARPDAQRLATHQSVGKFLEAPAMHHSIGTPLTKRMTRELEEMGVGEVLAHDKPPPFAPELVRAMEHPRHDRNWATRGAGSYMEKGILDAAHRGMTSSPHDTSYYAGLVDPSEFGKPLGTKGMY